MRVAEKLAFLEDIDWRGIGKELPDGCRSYMVDLPKRSVPFELPTVAEFEGTDEARAKGEAIDLSDVDGFDQVVPLEQRTTNRVIDDSGEGVAQQDGDSGSNDEVAFDELEPAGLLSGVASSTSVDFFGTEMSLRALKVMAVQMMRGNGMNVGVPYIPRHNRGFDALEWDEVIGRTVHAEVVPAEAVANAANDQEPQFLLRVTVRLIPVPADARERDDSEKAAYALMKRIRRGEVIGQSIGGWFTRLEMIENEKGEIERIIVHGVELDHLAVTRAPANPDSIGLVSLRSAAQELLRGLNRTELIDATNELIDATRELDRELIGAGVQARHIINVEENDETVTVTFEKHDGDDMGDDMGDDIEIEIEEGEPVDLSDVMEEESDASVILTELAVLNGARDGSDLSEEDRAQRYDELSTALASHDCEAPPMRTREQIEAERTLAESESRAYDLDAYLDAVESGDVDESMDSWLVRFHLNQWFAPSHGDRPSDTIRRDAHRSAAGHPLPTTTADAVGTPSEERAMSLTADQMRALLDEKVDPLVQRIDALEAQRTAAPSTPEPKTEPEVDTTPDPRIAELEAERDAALVRAQRAERNVDSLTSGGHRVGRAAVGLSAGSPMVASSVYDGMIDRCKSAAPTMARACTQGKKFLLGKNGDLERHATYAELNDFLRNLLNTAELDAVITPPSQRVAWS